MVVDCIKIQLIIFTCLRNPNDSALLYRFNGSSYTKIQLPVGIPIYDMFIDKYNVIWLASHVGLIKINNGVTTLLNSNNTNLTVGYESFYKIFIGNQNELILLNGGYFYSHLRVVSFVDPAFNVLVPDTGNYRSRINLLTAIDNTNNLYFQGWRVMELGWQVAQ